MSRPSRAALILIADDPNRSSSIQFDDDARTAAVASAYSESGLIDFSESLRVRGGPTPRELARRLRPRGPQKNRLQKRQRSSFSLSLDKPWERVEHLFGIW